MTCFLRDDVSWSDWLAVRQRAHGRPPEAVAAVAGQLRDWPDATRLVASDPEQQTDQWWVEGWSPEPQPWLTLVRALWVPADEIVELESDSAWVREGLRVITTWFVGQALGPAVTAGCRQALPALTTIDLTHFAGRGLETWVESLTAIDQLRFGGVAAESRLIDAVIARHGATLAGLELNGVGIGLTGLRRLSGWPSSGRLRHLAIRDDSLDLGMFARVERPWLSDLVSLDLERAGRAGRHHEWLRAPNLDMLSLNGIRLAGTARGLFVQAQLPRLRRLRVASTQLNIEGLDAAVNGSSAGTLACLDIRNNGLPDDALDVLNRPHQPGWSEIHLAENRFSPAALERFASQHGLVIEPSGVLIRRR